MQNPDAIIRRNTRCRARLRLAALGLLTLAVTVPGGVAVPGAAAAKVHVQPSRGWPAAPAQTLDRDTSRSGSTPVGHAQPRGMSRPGPAGLIHTPPRGTASSGQTWAGYAVTGTGPYTTITGRWTIPAMNCSYGGGDASPWVGIDGWSGGTVEQIGVDLYCFRGRAVYRAWIEMYPGPSDYFREPVHAGDTLTASVSVSRGTWTLTERDTTTGWARTFHRTPAHPKNRLSAEAIVEDVGNTAVPPLPDFGTVAFRGVTVDGTPLGSAGTVSRTTMRRGSTPLSRESPLSGGDFSVTWRHR